MTLPGLVCWMTLVTLLTACEGGTPLPGPAPETLEDREPGSGDAGVDAEDDRRQTASLRRSSCSVSMSKLA